MFELSGAGYQTDRLNTLQLCDKLPAYHYDLLVLCDAANMPLETKVSIETFLKKGGNIIVLRAPLWREGIVNVQGQFYNKEQYQRHNADVVPANIILNFNNNNHLKWTIEATIKNPPVLYEVIQGEDVPGGRGLYVQMLQLDSSDHEFGYYMISPMIDTAIPEDNGMVVFSAKGGKDTPEMVVELVDEKGISYIKVVPLFEQWMLYKFKAEDFVSAQNEKFDLKGIRKMKFGQNSAQTGYSTKRCEFWISPVGTSKNDDAYEKFNAADVLPHWDTLAPAKSFFKVGDVSALSLSGEQTIISQGLKFDNADQIYSPHPRSQGNGFNKCVNWRWMPLIHAQSEDGQWRGNPATMVLNFDGPFKGGMWASFGVQDYKWYTSKDVVKAIGDISRYMKRKVFLVDGGTDNYTYFEGQSIKLGARVIDFGQEAGSAITAKITMKEADGGRQVIVKEWPLNNLQSGIYTFSMDYKPEKWPEDGFVVCAEMYDNCRMIESVSHEIFAWKPKKDKNFVTVKNGDFFLYGKQWKPNGIVYMPSSGAATEDYAYFVNWLGKQPYAPEVIDRDLKKIKDIGFNAVSVYPMTPAIPLDTQNLVDLIRRIDMLGMKVNLFLQTIDPTGMTFDWNFVREAIAKYRLSENDTIFAYDICCEGRFEPQSGRIKWDSQWLDWIVERYGSIENAEKDWKFAVPRDENGNVTNPGHQYLYERGPWFRMSAAYRRFLDTLIYKNWSQNARLIKEVDSNHLVSFRMWEAGNPTYRWDKFLPYDMPYLAAAVDIFEPEAYGRLGNWECVKKGRYVFDYCRWADADKPVIWAECGCNTWGSGSNNTPERLLQYQADFYADFYKMLLFSQADGVFFWFYSGGYRYYENSDYGIVNPDGTDRAVTKVIRDFSKKFTQSNPDSEVDYWIEIDRDLHPDGVAGLYEQTRDEYWEAIESGYTPGFRTSGTGTDSANCPLTAVGNTEFNQNNPLKYLDAAFDSFQIKRYDGQWITVKDGDWVEFDPACNVVARISLTNLGESSWIKGDKDARIQKKGAVSIVANSSVSIKTPLVEPVRHLGSVELEDVEVLPAGAISCVEVTVGLLSEKRGMFGEKMQIKLKPDKKDAKPLADIIGSTHAVGRYHLTDKDFLNEGADQILELGSRVIKIWFYGKSNERPAQMYSYNSDWPEVNSLVGGAKLPYFKTLFDKPFMTYIFVVSSLGRPEDYWRQGITDADVADEQKQFYELTQYLLTAYSGTGKTFIFQHWEGDWMTRGHTDATIDPTEDALKNMVLWLNARQDGVTEARNETPHKNVAVYHAAEVNRVVSSMRDGRPNMVNKVLPYTHLDLVSYSAWDGAIEEYKTPEVLRQALDFIAQNVPDSEAFGEKNVYLGEFGWPENTYGKDNALLAVSQAVETGLEWGCPYIVYWQLYCNELVDPATKTPVKNNKDVRGFWLVRPDGTKSFCWDYFHQVLKQ
ncbi:hypothetical protein [Limihaloglobus sulfuriphilus]|nr:hypothetical protein [Limihaloglobus sulfuriphilus]